MLLASYSRNKQIGNKGASIVETALSAYAMAHRIDEAKDIGVDMLCELVYNELPTGILFIVQVKASKNHKLKCQNTISENNYLPEYKYTKKIGAKTLGYWKGFNIPIYLFLVNPDTQDIFYKRYTAILHDLIEENDSPAYLATFNNRFQAYLTPNNKFKTGGFCRDLFFDHLRCQHEQGLLSSKNPADFGLIGWERDVIYRGVYDDYAERIKDTFKKYKRYLKNKTALDRLSYEPLDPTF